MSESLQQDPRTDSHDLHHSHEWIASLIRAVKRREPIWDRQHPQYKDREYSMILWAEVSKETGVDVETARCKWRGLRDTFRVQLRKLNQSAKNGTPSPPTWEYFDYMLFVKDQIYIDINRKKYVTREKILEEYGYGRHGETEAMNAQQNDSGEEEIANVNAENPSNCGSLLQSVAFPIQTAIEQAIRLKMEQPTGTHHVHSALYAETRSVQSEEDTQDIDYQVPAELCVAEVKEDPEVQLVFAPVAESELQTTSLCSDGEQENDQVTVHHLQKKLRALQDDNYCFLMSLLPQMKTLTTKQKLFVRIKIQELLFSEILNMENRD